jgi:hypothetical protein
VSNPCQAEEVAPYSELTENFLKDRNVCWVVSSAFSVLADLLIWLPLSLVGMMDYRD